MIYITVTYCLNHFHVIEKFATHKDLPKYRFPHTEALTINGKIIRKLNSIIPFGKNYEVVEKSFEFDPDILNISNSSYLIGYWQNEKYFEPIQKYLLKEFTLKYPLNDMSEILAEQIVKTNSIAVHFRNYGNTTNKYLFQRPDIHGVLPETYYHKALKIILQRVENPHLFLFSDTAKVLFKNLIPKIPYTAVTQNINSSHERSHVNVSV